MVNQSTTIFVGLLVFCTVLSVYGTKCTHKGTSHKNGATWGEKCVKYTCKDGQVKLAREGCDDGGVCRKVDAHWTKHCIEYKCVHLHGKYLVRSVSQKCQGVHGKCHKFGEQWKENTHGNCVVKKCAKKHHAAQAVTVSKC
ncbi:uncharacterized protein LOC115222714 [Argonauta hians]